MEQLCKAPVVTTARHRMQTDGQGITTLVCFYGCPLRCKYCLNPFTFAPGTRHQEMTAQELYDRVKGDELYFLATGGGVTFGGGEPLLYGSLLKEFREICGMQWHLCAETSLNVPVENIPLAAQCVDEFFVDCKDTNPEIYRRYTGKDNALMLENLRQLLRLVGPERVVVRLPLIPGYNCEADRAASRVLLEQMGVTRFDLFTYRTDIKKT